MAGLLAGEGNVPLKTMSATPKMTLQQVCNIYSWNECLLLGSKRRSRGSIERLANSAGRP